MKIHILNFAEFINESKTFTGKPVKDNITLADAYEDNPEIQDAIMKYLGANKLEDVLSSNNEERDDNFDALEKKFKWGTQLKDVTAEDYLETSEVNGKKVVGTSTDGFIGFFWKK